MFVLGYLAARRGALAAAVRARPRVLGVLLAQMALGEIQYRTHLPWWLVLVHVAARRRGLGGLAALVTLLAAAGGSRASAGRRLRRCRRAPDRPAAGARAARADRRLPRLERRGAGGVARCGYLAKTWDAEQFAEIDPEDFYDFQASRPSVTLEDGKTRRIEWPETGFYHARPAGLDRDVVLLIGIEPSIRWRTFGELVVGLASRLGVDL